jgi:hypothetical protein
MGNQQRAGWVRHDASVDKRRGCSGLNMPSEFIPSVCEPRLTLSPHAADPPGTVRWFRYVHHTKRAEYEAKGWQFSADLGHPHNRWSVLMEAPEGYEPMERIRNGASA